MKLVFVSNYINHHQIPFCLAMRKRLGEDFAFIQTEPMEEERIRMGWQAEEGLDFVRFFYKEEELCRRWILESELVLFGGTDEEAYVKPRLAAGRPLLRYTERIYKTGQWKMITPRGLIKKYQDHIRYRNRQVYLLCAGAYVASDFHLIGAYPDKMYRWGYFPEEIVYREEELMGRKGDSSCARLIWAGRFIPWKHAEQALHTAAFLKEQGCAFHLDIIGGGEGEAGLKELRKELKLEDHVAFRGFLPPEQVREYMERADICLMTSDREEGWGAVANEAMNSGCALVANHMAGAVPYLIRQGENGMIYQDKRWDQLYRMTEGLVRDRQLCRRLGREACRTIREEWNPERAADSLLELCASLKLLEPGEPWKSGGFITPTGPCSRAPVISERYPFGGQGLFP